MPAAGNNWPTSTWPSSSSTYPPGYLVRPTVDRVLEIIEKFEEDITDKARLHGQLKVVLEVGEAIEVSPSATARAAVDPLMTQIQQSLQAMIDRLAAGVAAAATGIESAQTASMRRLDSYVPGSIAPSIRTIQGSQTSADRSTVISIFFGWISTSSSGSCLGRKVGLDFLRFGFELGFEFGQPLLERLDAFGGVADVLPLAGNSPGLPHRR